MCVFDWIKISTIQTYNSWLMREWFREIWRIERTVGFEHDAKLLITDQEIKAEKKKQIEKLIWQRNAVIQES